MVELKEQQFFIDGESKIILSGEIHYYRLYKDQWQKALDGLKEAGGNCVATYIPWLCHEYKEGDFDFTGKYHEENDLVSFLKLVKENELYFIARPGPFVMAEMKNEGIPHWVFDKDENILPKTWDGRITYNRTCDYLNPTYLSYVKKWYDRIIEILIPYNINHGGNMIALQLDNEVGMLSWVCNCPDLTDVVCDDFRLWLQKKYNNKEITNRYGFDFSLAKNEELRSPKEDYALKYHQDLGYYMRYRSMKYCEILASYCTKLGIDGIPYIINIHGSGGRRASNYPIGISQLLDVIRGDNNYLPGSDMYMGSVDLGNFQDLYIANMFARAVSLDNQPLSSMEFEGSACDYNNNYDDLTEPQALDIKTRLFIALGNKMINYYLFCGGHNYRLDESLKDGNGRISFTGEQHGYKAPLDPNADKNVIFESVSEAINTIKNNSKYLADMFPCLDNIVLGFIPDYYMTEFHYPNSAKQKHLHAEIKLVRDNGALNVISRALILNNYSFDVVNMQSPELDAKLQERPLVVCIAKYCPKEVQESIVEYMKTDHNVILYGAIPQYDMNGEDCTILADYLKVKPLHDFRDLKYNHISIYPDGRWRDLYEIRSGIGETLDLSMVDNAEVILREYETKEPCGYIQENENQVICVITSYFGCKLQAFDSLYKAMGVNKKVSYLPKHYGTFTNMVVNKKNEGYINIFDLDGYPKADFLYLDGEKLFNEKINLSHKKCVMLPINLKISENITIVKALAEFVNFKDNTLIFKPFQDNTEIVLNIKNVENTYNFNKKAEIKIKI